MKFMAYRKPYDYGILWGWAGTWSFSSRRIEKSSKESPRSTVKRNLEWVKDFSTTGLTLLHL